MGSVLRFCLLLLLKAACRVFYRFDVEWVGPKPADRWRRIRIIAVLNHTSLYEPLYAALLPLDLLWHLARHGVVPVAAKTLARPGVGWLLRLVARHVVSVSRRRDASWREVVRYFEDPSAITIIFPEGRMLRRTGLDVDGQPMTVRGGIADLLAGVPTGRMLLAYSGGLHHIAAPGDRFPRLFQRIAVRLELLEIPEYRTSLDGTASMETFRRRVIQDLTLRRNRYCPIIGPTTPEWAA
jgi:1-acyl-sn-glycerol-3-phosphate acyltransferase